MNNKIREIVENFDWEKVNKVMKCLNWRWAFSKTENQIPSIGELVLQGIRLLEEVNHSTLMDKSNHYRGTGGFEAKGIYLNESDEVILELSFTIESWESDIDE